MEETNFELPPVKRLKLAVEEESVVVELENRSQVANFKSPITEPVLTPEIWDQIFRDFTGTDFISVINATPEWNQLLGSRKTTELFAKLIHHVLPYLDFHDILACRQIQRGSKVAVDKFLENCSTSSEQAFNFQHDGYPLVLSEIEKISDNYALCTRLEIDKFSRAHSLRKMPSTYNPFITRTLCVDIEIPQDEDEAQRLASDHARMTKFLSRYGTHIWRFNIHFYQLFNGVAKLIKYLHFLPNLMILELSGNADMMDMRFFRNKELPPLQHLEHLAVTDLRAHSITSRIIQRYGAQLITLVVPGSWIKYSRIERSDFKVLLPKLKRLRIVDADASTLGKLAGVEWPVDILHIRLEASLTVNDNKRELLLQALSNFQSLSHVELFFEEELAKYTERGLNMDSLVEFDTEGQDLDTLEEESLAIADGALEQLSKLQKVGIAWESADTVFVKTRSKVQ